MTTPEGMDGVPPNGASEPVLKKVRFPLVRDQDGYPPADSEGLWTIMTGHDDQYVVDNIPFFTEGIALGDKIQATMQQGLLTFDDVVQEAGHSTLWVFTEDPKNMALLRATLHSRGLRTESDEKRGMIAIDVPVEASYESLIEYLESGEKAGKWEYAEGAVRHRPGEPQS